MVAWRICGVGSNLLLVFGKYFFQMWDFVHTDFLFCFIWLLLWNVEVYHCLLFDLDKLAEQGAVAERMSENKRFQLGTIGALSLSVVSSVSIVICNKALMSSLGFRFGELIVIVWIIILQDACHIEYGIEMWIRD